MIKIMLIALCLLCSGCKAAQPPRIQWGQKGEAPTAVFNDYDWIIMDRDLQ